MVAGALSEDSQAKLDGLQDNFNDLQESMLLTRVHTEMADVETTLSLLPSEIETVRTRGYAFRSFLENKVNVLSEQWDEIKTAWPERWSDARANWNGIPTPPSAR